MTELGRFADLALLTISAAVLGTGADRRLAVESIPVRGVR
jgi:hypothetical protein